MRNAQLLVVLLTLFFINDSDASCENYTTYLQDCKDKYCIPVYCLVKPCPEPLCFNSSALSHCMSCRCNGGVYSDC
ncbi:UNVERIFIED_CONTAM: hypothetical protein RMT77_019230 [Armadillidium vulgare]